MRSIGFLDILFNGLLTFIMLFGITFALIRPFQDPGGVKTKAEYIIQLTWSDESTADVDLWVQSPGGWITCFKQPESPAVHIDRDDLGMVNDEYTDVNGITHFIKFNQEIITIRQVMAGDWCVNIHMYNLRGEEKVPIRVTIQKINPEVKDLLIKDLEISIDNEEIHIAKLTMDRDGKFIKSTDKPAVSLVKQLTTVVRPTHLREN